MKATWLYLLLGLNSVSWAAGPNPSAGVVTETVVVIRLGPFSAKGARIGSYPQERYVDLIESDIIEPEALRKYGAALVLPPSPANGRFKKEEGRYAKLLLGESELGERLRAGLFIFVPASLPTASTMDALGRATPVTMKEPPREKEANRSAQTTPGLQPSASDP